MSSKKIRAIVIVAACSAFGFVAVQAAIIVVHTPLGATASSTLPGRPASQTIDGSGLQFATPAAITSTSQLPNHNESPETGGGMWLVDNGNGPTGSIIFDLGSVKRFHTLYVWNYAEVAFANTTPIDESDRSARNVTLYADNTPSPTTLVQPLVFNEAVNTPLASANVGGSGSWNLDYNTAVGDSAYTLTSSVTLRYFKFDITSNWSDPSFVGLSEIRFGQTVPEPMVLTVIASGLILLVRRRKIRA